IKEFKEKNIKQYINFENLIKVDDDIFRVVLTTQQYNNETNENRSVLYEVFTLKENDGEEIHGLTESPTHTAIYDVDNTTQSSNSQQNINNNNEI
ncbi:MAG: hypothetical protein LBC92_02655, partial [Rickettsiales bacterium]|nr:hypothetical protein [Rickettsiales bacterium]